MARYEVDDYVDMASQALMELIRQEGAVLWREAEAKIADNRWPTMPVAINPHHLTTARGNLLARHWITLSDPLDASGTRLLVPTDNRGKRDLIRTASRRRRVLHERLETWARPTKRYPNGLIGEAESASLSARSWRPLDRRSSCKPRRQPDRSPLR